MADNFQALVNQQLAGMRRYPGRRAGVMGGLAAAGYSLPAALRYVRQSFNNARRAAARGRQLMARRGRHIQVKRGKKRSLNTFVLKDGTSATKYKKKKKGPATKRRKLSVRQELSKVKQLIPPKSHKTYRDFQTIVFDGSNPNQHITYDIACFNVNADYERYAANLVMCDEAKTMDYTQENTKLKFSLYYKLMVKNNMTANATVKYAFYICSDDTNDYPTTQIINELGDRGYGSLPTPDGPYAATTSAAYQTRRVIWSHDNPYHVPIFGNRQMVRRWKQVGKVQTTRIGPGDYTELIWTDPNHIYRPEDKDVAGSTNYLKGHSVRLLLDVSGDLCHDATQTKFVGRSGFQLDAEAHKQCTVTYSNPKALNDVAYTDTLSNDVGAGEDNFDPVHADNNASAIERDNITP